MSSYVCPPSFEVLTTHAEVLRDLYGKKIREEFSPVYLERDNVLAALASLRPGGKKKILYIAGTNDKADWLANLDCFGNSQFHRGFYKYAMAVRELAWENTDTDEVVVAIVGHSLGGAAAAVLGVFANMVGHSLGNQHGLGMKSFSSRVETITFGAPRFGRKALRRLRCYYELCEGIWHIQHKGDVVPNRPGGVGVGNWRLPYFCRPGAVLRYAPRGQEGIPDPLQCHTMEGYARTMAHMAQAEKSPAAE